MDLGSRAIEYYGLRERKIFSIFLPYLVERIESVTERLKISPNMAKKNKKNPRSTCAQSIAWVPSPRTITSRYMHTLLIGGRGSVIYEIMWRKKHSES